MNVAEIVSHILRKCGLTAASEFSENGATDLLLTLNIKKDEICEAITDAFADYFGTNKTMDLSDTDSISNRIFDFDYESDILNNIVKIEACFDSAADTPQWVEVRYENRPWSEIMWSKDWIYDNYDNIYPKYKFFAGKLYLLSGEVDDNEGSIRIWWIQYPDDITDLADTIDLSGSLSIRFPKQFHELLARAVIVDWKEANQKPLTGREVLFDQDLAIKINRLKGINLSETAVGRLVDDDGSDY